MHDGPEMRMTAIAARPGAVERAYMVLSSRLKTLLVSLWISLLHCLLPMLNGRRRLMHRDRIKLWAGKLKRLIIGVL